MRLIQANKRIKRNYHVLDTWEVGLVLQGTEVKSILNNQVDFTGSFILVKNTELFLHNFHVGRWQQGGVYNHDEKRVRKLLAHKKEIQKMNIESSIKGQTLVPFQLLYKNKKIKMVVALCQGVKKYDKRADIKNREDQKEVRKFI